MTGCVFLFFSDGQAGLLIDRFDQRTEEELVRVDVFLASLLFFFLIRNLLGFHAWIIGRWFDVGRSQTWFGCRACVRVSSFCLFVAKSGKWRVAHSVRNYKLGCLCR